MQIHIIIWMISVLLIVGNIILRSILFPHNYTLYGAIQLLIIIVQAVSMCEVHVYYDKKVKNIKTNGIRVH